MGNARWAALRICHVPPEDLPTCFQLSHMQIDLGGSKTMPQYWLLLQGQVMPRWLPSRRAMLLLLPLRCADGRLQKRKGYEDCLLAADGAAALVEAGVKVPAVARQYGTRHG